MSGGISAGTIFTTIAGAVASSVISRALAPKPQQQQGMAASSLLSPNDPSNGQAQAEREAAADAERRRVASARGFDSTNPTGGTGDTSAPNLAAKSLLGE